MRDAIVEISCLSDVNAVVPPAVMPSNLTIDPTNPPMGIGDSMNRERSFKIPATLPRGETVTKVKDTIPAGGVNMYLQAFYIDELDLGPPVTFGMLAFEGATFAIHINP